MAQKQFDAVAEKLDLDQGSRDFLRTPMREYHFNIPLFITQAANHFFDKISIIHNQQVGIENAGVFFAERGADFVLKLRNLVPCLNQGFFKPDNFKRHILFTDDPF